MNYTIRFVQPICLLIPLSLCVFLITQRCAQSCQGNSPCEGIKPEWEDGFMTPVACWGSMPWKTFNACLTTLSPTAPPPTLVPTVRPMRKHIAPLTRVSCYAPSVIGFLFAALFCYASMYACVRSGMRLREPQERLCCSCSKKHLFLHRRLGIK